MTAAGPAPIATTMPGSRQSQYRQWLAEHYWIVLGLVWLLGLLIPLWPES